MQKQQFSDTNTIVEMHFSKSTKINSVHQQKFSSDLNMSTPGYQVTKPLMTEAITATITGECTRF